MNDVILEARAITRAFSGFRALRGVDLDLRRNEVLAIVGESGSGKSTLANILLGIIEPSSGTYQIDGRVPPVRWPRSLRRKIQQVAQNPALALNPRRTIYESLVLPLTVHGIVPRAHRRDKVAELLELVNLPASMMLRRPGSLSGGQRQRIALARAIASQPDVLILDEPTSALDVSVQASILALLKDIRTRLSLSFVFITHDLAVARLMSDRIVVMHQGLVVEEGPTAQIFALPMHRYTQMLIAAIPVVTPEENALKPVWPYEDELPADEHQSEVGCRFAPQCNFRTAECRSIEPDLLPAPGGRSIRCFHSNHAPLLKAPPKYPIQEI